MRCSLRHGPNEYSDDEEHETEDDDLAHLLADNEHPT